MSAMMPSKGKKKRKEPTASTGTDEEPILDEPASSSHRRQPSQLQEELRHLTDVSLNAFGTLVCKIVEDAKHDGTVPRTASESQAQLLPSSTLPSGGTETAAARSLLSSLHSKFRNRSRTVSPTSTSPPELEVVDSEQPQSGHSTLAPATTASTIARGIVRSRSTGYQATPLLDQAASADPPEASATDRSLALALASLLENVLTLIDADRDPTPEEWTGIGSAMHTISAMCNQPAAASLTQAQTLKQESSPLLKSIDGRDIDSASTLSATSITISTAASSPEKKQARRLSLAPQPVSTRTPDRTLRRSCDLEPVLMAIERLQSLRMVDQTVTLRPEQQQRMDLAATGAQIDRLARGRMQDQRAVYPPAERAALFNHVMDVGDRDFSNQRVHLTPRATREFELARLGAVVDRLAARSRMGNQDAMTRAHKRSVDFERLAVELTRLCNPAAMATQRYEMSEAKERDLFLKGVAHRVSRLNESRLTNQAADGPKERRERAFSEVDQVMDRMFKEDVVMSRQRC